MGLRDYFVAAALTLGLAATGTAQTTTNTVPATTQPTYYGTTVSHWIASGFVGSGFNASGDAARVDEGGNHAAFGGQVGYLWRGVVGAEFLAEWAPTFDVNSVLLPDNAHVASYMFNVIGAYPLGVNGQFQPFVSGGFGPMQMAADILSADTTTHVNSNADWGSNIGGGLMAFANNRFGVRGDIRYYHASDNITLDGSAADQFVESLMSGLHFWRASGGLSFRW